MVPGSFYVWVGEMVITTLGKKDVQSLLNILDFLKSVSMLDGPYADYEEDRVDAVDTLMALGSVPKEFSPESLEQLAGNIDDLRAAYLFDMDAAGAEVIAEQYYLMALSLLDQAHRVAMLAHYSQVRALAQR